MNVIRVLHFFGIMDMGGAETFVMNLYRNINRDKIQFEFAVVSAKKGSYDDEINRLGGKIHILPSPKREFVKYRKKLIELLNNRNFDAVHSHVHFFSGINLRIAKKCGVKTRIAHSHTYNLNSNFYFKKSLYEKIMGYLIQRSSTNLLACSKEAANELYFINSERAEVIINGIDLKQFVNKKYTKEEYRKQLELPLDSFIIGHVGAFRPEKNHKKLIEIFLSVLERENNAHLVMVGEGDQKLEIERLVREIGIEEKVHFLGVREDIDDILNAFDVFVFPSLYEGLGIAVVEAQVSGLYCIVSDTLPRSVDITGNISFISLNADLGEWAVAILNNTCKDIESSKVQQYDIKSVSKRMYEIYSR